MPAASTSIADIGRKKLKSVKENLRERISRNLYHGIVKENIDVAATDKVNRSIIDVFTIVDRAKWSVWTDLSAKYISAK
jgi:hypothetical protein